MYFFFYLLTHLEFGLFASFKKNWTPELKYISWKTKYKQYMCCIFCCKNKELRCVKVFIHLNFSTILRYSNDTSTALHFRGKYCTFYSTTFMDLTVTPYLKMTADMTPLMTMKESL